MVRNSGIRTIGDPSFFMAFNQFNMRLLVFTLIIQMAFIAKAQQKNIYTQTISPKGSLIAISKDKLVYVYELTSDESKFNVSMGEDIAGSGFSNDEKLFIVMDYNYVFRAFDLDNEGEEVWSSDILEFIDRPDERFKVRILESQSGDYVLAQHMGQSIVLDRYTGELVGYADLDIELYSQRDDDPISVWSSGPNSFEIMNIGSRDYCIAELKIEGYGAIETNKKFGNTNVAFPVLAHYPGRSLIYETDEWQTKTEVLLHGKPFRKGKGDRVDFPDGVFSPDGKYLATGKFTEKAAVYEYASGKRIAQLEVKQVPYFVNESYVVFGGYKAGYQVYSARNGNQVFATDHEEDLKYKGTSIARSASTRAAGVVFFDDFDDNFNEWNTKVSEGNSKRIVNGKYVMESEENRYGIWNSKIAIDQYRDFELEVKLKCDPMEEDKEYGIFWGRNYEFGYRNVFRLKNTGKYYIGKYQRGKWYASQAWLESELVKPSDYNVIKVRKEGNVTSYFLNDQKVLEEPFKGFLGNKVGFDYVPGTMEVDYIKVSYLSESSQSEIPVYADEFTDNTDKWLSKRKEGSYDQQILEGYFRYEVMAEKTSYTKWNNKMFIDQDKDYIFETAVKFDASSSNGLLGMAWGRAEKGGKQYRFGFSPKGNFRVDYYNGSSYVAVTDWKGAGIDLNAFTKLKIKKIGEEYKFFINDKVVAIEAGLEGFGPIAGFVIPEQTIAHIDYIRVKYINSRSSPYRSYASRTGKRIYIPYMRPNNPANRGGKVLIGEALYCDRPPKMEAGGMGFATTTQKVKWDYWILDEEDEIEFGKKELREIYPGGWLVWEHNIKCK